MTTHRMHLRSWDLDTLLLDSSSDERNESLLMLQRLDDTQRELDRWEDLDRQEQDILRRWQDEKDSQEG